jgi:hypothetical protein
MKCFGGPSRRFQIADPESNTELAMPSQQRAQGAASAGRHPDHARLSAGSAQTGRFAESESWPVLRHRLGRVGVRVRLPGIGMTGSSLCGPGPLT